MSFKDAFKKGKKSAFKGTNFDETEENVPLNGEEGNEKGFKKAAKNAKKKCKKC